MQPASISGQSLGGETYTSEMNPKLKGKFVPQLALDTIEDEYCAPPYTHDAAEDVGSQVNPGPYALSPIC